MRRDRRLVASRPRCAARSRRNGASRGASRETRRAAGRRSSRAPADARAPPASGSRPPASSSRSAGRPSGGPRPGSAPAPSAGPRAAPRSPQLAPVGIELGPVGQPLVDQQVGHLLVGGPPRRSRRCRSRGSGGRCRCGPRCRSRSCPPATPERATDFLARGTWACLFEGVNRRPARPQGLVPKQPVELLLVSAVVEDFVEFRRGSACARRRPFGFRRGEWRRRHRAPPRPSPGRRKADKAPSRLRPTAARPG